MNLEAIEQRCLDYLSNVTNPLVPVAQLLSVLNEDDDCAGVSEAELLAFLRKHDLFTVIEPPNMNATDPAELEAARMMTAPRVMLTSRIPAKAELVGALQREMGTMLNALEAAMTQARGEKNPRLAMEVQAILKRARELQQKVGDAGLG